ncbi:MAG: helix-turn-helix transcriptional regulator [Balneola sp.]
MEDNKKGVADIIGLTIRELRTKKNYSQEKLAELSSLDMTYISLVETSKRNITVKSLLKICKALDVKLTDFTKLIDKKIDYKS